MSHSRRIYRLFSSTLLLLTISGPSWSADAEKTDSVRNASGNKPIASPATAAAEHARTLNSPGGALTKGSRTLQTQQEKLSYALGANLGNGLRRESIDVEADLVIQGLKDALS